MYVQWETYVSVISIIKGFEQHLGINALPDTHDRSLIRSIDEHQTDIYAQFSIPTKCMHSGRAANFQLRQSHALMMKETFACCWLKTHNFRYINNKKVEPVLWIHTQLGSWS